MAIAVVPSDSGKSMTRSVVICCHFCSGSGIGCNTPAFFLWSDFTNWQTGCGNSGNSAWGCHGNWFGKADCVPDTSELIGEDLGAILSLGANQ